MSPWKVLKNKKAVVNLLGLLLAEQFVYFLTTCGEALFGLSPCLDKRV